MPRTPSDLTLEELAKAGEQAALLAVESARTLKLEPTGFSTSEYHSPNMAPERPKKPRTGTAA